MRTVGYMLFYFVILQVALQYGLPGEWVYHYRLDYEVAKHDMAAYLHRAIDAIAEDLHQTKPEEYVILLGDSVAYSGPGGPDQSIGYYLEQWSRQQGRPLRVYNLAQPAMQAGDIYTVLLMLEEHGVPLDRVVVSLIYAGFVAREPDPPVVFWLQDELQRLDPQSWKALQGHLGAASTPAAAQGAASWQARFREQVLGSLPLWRYRHVLRARVERLLGLAAGGEVQDTRPWYEKEGIRELVRQPLYQRVVDPRPFDMTPANPHVAMLERILARTRGAEVLFFLSPLNQELMAEGVEHPGYRANLRRIDAWFAAKSVAYLNLESTLPDDRFADHVHLTPAGYQELAVQLGEHLLTRGGGARALP